MSEEREETYSNREQAPDDMDKVERDPTKIEFNPEDLKKVPKSLWGFVKSTLNIREDTDVAGTISEIQDEIEFKGHNVWVLIFSIFVASIGLDADSVAVVIGAMLISPLMGPIKGIGLAVGTNDFKLLMKSLVNFGVMIGISILVSWIYFVISPFKEPSAQILARTEPDFRDVLIALFGGFAGIIAATKKGKSMTVISGVAIATALMPPLCSAGFMLANGNFGLMANALYLFIINSILICLATLIVIRYLRFPLKEFVNPKTERKVKIYIGVFMLLVLIPSVYKFYFVMQENSFKRNSQEFIAQEIEGYARVKHVDLEYMHGDTVNIIHIEFREDNFVPPIIVEQWERKLADYDLHNTILDIDKTDLLKEEKAFSFEDRIALEERHRSEKDELKREIDLNETMIHQQKKLLKAYKDITSSKVKKLRAEIDVTFPDVKRFTYSLGFENSGRRTDTVALFTVEWKPYLSDSLRQIETGKLTRWLKADLNRKNIRVIDLNHGKKQKTED